MPAIIEEKTVRGLREVALLGFFTIAIFFFISLVTFSNEDAGWTHSGSMQSISNACGVIGAWVADFVLSLFGLMAYLFPVMFLWYGYRVYTTKQQQRGKLILAIRWLGFIAIIISGCAIFYLHILRLQVELPGSTGGILGEEIGDILLIVLGNSGATLLFLAVFLAGITLFTGLSWINLLDTVGQYTLQFCYAVHQRSWSLFGTYRDHYIQPKVVEKDRLATHGITPKITPLLKHKKSQTSLFKPDILVPKVKNTSLSKGKLPPISLLDKRLVTDQGYSAADLEEMSHQVEAVLQDFNVAVKVVDVFLGPVITRFELQLATGVKVSRVSGLEKDIARGLSIISVRIVEVIQGKSVIGLEIPNRERQMVSFRDLIGSQNFAKSKSTLTLAMGKDISGIPIMADLGKMPHVLVAGTTGSGKSVAINTMILSLLYKSTPEQVRIIMIDPKMLELSVYEGIPHLLTPVVTDMKDAQNTLRWAVAEMDRRYKLMSKLGVRNLAGYNQKIANTDKTGGAIRNHLQKREAFSILKPLPNIVIIIDELADMMMIVGKKVEELIARLAQKARASGIHLVLATQRPSVDVLTGLIKANVPTRISFQVSSRIDSRTILDQGGAEVLLGNGDMLFLPSGTHVPIRIHGAFVDDHEVHKIVDFLKQTAPPNYLAEITREQSDTDESTADREEDSKMDALYDEAVMFVTETRKASISSVQRRFKVGYSRAARIIKDMETTGVVSRMEGNGSREVLAPVAPKD